MNQPGELEKNITAEILLNSVEWVSEIATRADTRLLSLQIVLPSSILKDTHNQAEEDTLGSSHASMYIC